MSFRPSTNCFAKETIRNTFFLHHGDICFADDGPVLVPPKTYEQAMDYCQSKMSVLTSIRFYMTAPDNHEMNCTEVPGLYDQCPADQKNQIPYSHRFNMPSNQSNGYLNSWYSFNYVFVHVITLSCESDLPGAASPNLLDNATQINWLKNDLVATNRTITPWVIVQCHRPWKGSKALETQFSGGIVNCPACRAAFENVLIQYNVDIYVAGHVHWYERICLNSTINTTNYDNPDSPVYLTNGGIGSPEGNEHVQTRSNDSCVVITQPGFGILAILDASHATFTYYRVSDLVELDQFNITKNH